MRIVRVVQGMVFAGWLCCAGGPLAFAQDVHVKVSAAYKVMGETEFPTIQNALDHAPQPGPRSRLFIHIAPGTYSERVYVSQLRPRTTLLGMGAGPEAVVIQAKQNPQSSQSTFFSETAEILADDFQADNITFENAAGATGQAVAVSATADRMIFKKCRFLGYQDTLFANYGRQLYLDSYVGGAVDFIFGNATAVFVNSEIHVTHAGYVTAQSRTSSAETTGFVFLHSRVTADDLGGKTFFLGRPWRSFARVVYLHTELPASVDPQGWNDWKKDTTGVFFGEFASTGPGAPALSRVGWSHALKADEVAQYEPKRFLAGGDHWDAMTEAARLP